MSEFESASLLLGAVTETESLRETVLTLSQICDSADIAEIIVCYSPQITDGCKKVIEELNATELGMPFNAFCQTRPFMAFFDDMIDAATGSHCVLISSDLSLDLSVVPEMIRGAKAEPDTIFSCSRFLPGCKFYGYGKIKKIINICAQKYLRVLYGVKYTDLTDPCQIAPTELYRAINFEETGFSRLPEIVLKPLRLGYKFTELPTNCYSRKDGKSRNSFMQTARYLKTSLHIRFMKREDILKNKSYRKR